MPFDVMSISTSIFPFLKALASGLAEKLATRYADKSLADTYRLLVPDQKLLKANQAFVSRFSKELDSSVDLETLNGEAYRTALESFLKNPTVQEEIQLPLDGQSGLDWKLLSGIWAELMLIPLPDEFSWDRVARTYKQTIERQMISDPLLRPIIQAVAMLRLASATESMTNNVDSFDLSRYATAIKRTYSFLKLGSIDSDWTYYERRVRLDSVYVPQSVKQALPPRDLTRDYRLELESKNRQVDIQTNPKELQDLEQEYQRVRRSPLLEVVDDPKAPYLVILGDPGLGKSTLLRHLVLRWAEEPTRPLTILIELRRLVSSTGLVSFFDYLERGTGNVFSLAQPQLRKYLKDEESLILFDGLDEVPEAIREDAVVGIIRFAEDHPLARMIVTTRIHGYCPGSAHPEQFQAASFQQFTLQDFGDAEISHFISSWHQEAFADPDERAIFDRRLRNAIADSPAIRELSGNPLLLTLMTILSRSQDLPRDRGKLYERCAELLLKDWDLEKFPELKEKVDTRDVKDKLGPSEKMRILEQVAQSMQDEKSGLSGNLVAEHRLRTIIEKELAQLNVPQPWSVAEDMIWMLRERNFMLAYMGDRQYAFIHRTFLEYFCARHLKNLLERTSAFTVDNLRELFRTRWREDEWHEVLRLLCGLIGSEYASQCISDLLGLQSLRDGAESVFLAAQCLREVREVGRVRDIGTKVRSILIRIAKTTNPPRSDALTSGRRCRSVAELARGWRDDGEIALLLRFWADSDLDPSVRQVAIKEYSRARIDPDGLVSFLQQCCVTDGDGGVRHTALQEYARVLTERSSGTEALLFLKRRAVDDLHAAVREVAIEEVARRWHDEPNTYEWLRSQAICDDWIARRAAIRELAAGWVRYAETFGFVTDRAVEDTHFAVRAAALQEISRNWRDDPATLAWVRDRATNDGSKEVRQLALEELARGWGHRPEVGIDQKGMPGLVLHHRDAALRSRGNSADMDHISALQRLSISPVAEDVRKKALQQLARVWKERPETLDWLSRRAVIEANPAVRLIAFREIARGWPESLDTETLLKDRATADPDPEIRQMALYELAQHWMEQPSTRALLMDRAVNDQSDMVRSRVLLDIANGRREDPVVNALLVDRVTNDDAAGVREIALTGLAQVWNVEPTVLSLIRHRAVADRTASVRRVAVDFLATQVQGDPVTLNLLKNRAASDDDHSVRQLALEHLVARWRYDPEVGILLRKACAPDQRSPLRQSALHMLSLHWEDDSATVDLLKESLGDRDSAVRCVSIRGLARRKGNEPGVLTLIKRLAEQDEATVVRQTAFRELANAWKDEPTIFDLLKVGAASDQAALVRQTALQELAKGWPHTRQTVDILADRAYHDNAKEVRWIAMQELSTGWNEDFEVRRLLLDLREREKKKFNSD